jgi:hypothetical protein
MKSIALVNVFFGKFPWYFNFFLKSCSTNPTVNFLIFTDQERPKNCPANVEFIPFSLKQFNSLASERLNLKIEIKYAYKLCDFKPAYGIILSDYLKDYEYWGITDIDLIFGRIREFITDEMLTTYEVISVINDYPTGSFMIFENKEKTNWLFKKSKDYKKIFTSDKHYCFDECNFVHQYLEDGGDIFEIETEIESMHHILMHEIQNNNLKVHFDFLIIEGLPGKLFWNNGLLSFKNEFEVLHYHLILYKANQYTLKRDWKEIPNQFYIDKYLIRKKGLLSILDYLFNDNIRIWFKKANILIEYYLSVKISKTRLKNINNSAFVNGNYKRFIIKNECNDNFLSFNLDYPNYILYKSIFKNNNIFFKENKHLHYKIINNTLIEITKDGSTFKLEKE